MLDQIEGSHLKLKMHVDIESGFALLSKGDILSQVSKDHHTG